MKFKTATLTILTLLFSLNAWSADNEKQEYAKPNFPAVPALQAGQYAIFVETKYEIFKTEKKDDLEYSLGCLTNKNCEAAKAAKDSSAPKYKTAVFHPAAQFCETRGGKNLIALDNKKDEYNFCRFKDGTMVNSWSLYLKHNPKKIIK